MRTILAATHLSLRGNDALYRACRIASDHCAALVLLHVAPRALAPGKRAILGEELAEIAEPQNRRCRYPRTLGTSVRLHRSFADMLIDNAPFDMLIRHRH